MSYINIYKVETVEEDRTLVVPRLGDHTERGGGEIGACVRILQLLDHLNDGEAIVITVNNS
jgi:lysophospholipid acyltransferase (LPLAT)-like uncharacterized protein